MATTRVWRGQFKLALDEAAVRAYSVDLERISDIARRYRVSRQAVWRFLQDRGVNTGTRRVEVKCKMCHKSKEVSKRRARMQSDFFCTHACYVKWMRSSQGKAERDSRRVDREYLIRRHDLPDTAEIAFADGDSSNLRLVNLLIFKTPQEKERYERGLVVDGYLPAARVWLRVKKPREMLAA